MKIQFRESFGTTRTEEEIDGMVDSVMDSGKGMLARSIQSKLDEIEGTFGMIAEDSQTLFSQLATVPTELVQSTSMGPTVPNPVNITNTIFRIKSQGNSLCSLLSKTLSTCLELGIQDYVPSMIVTIADVLSKIKKFTA